MRRKIWFCRGCSDYDYGLWWFIAFGLRVTIKAPWSLKLFSEREGYKRYFPRNGWRVRVERS